MPSLLRWGHCKPLFKVGMQKAGEDKCQEEWAGQVGDWLCLLAARCLIARLVTKQSGHCKRGPCSMAMHLVEGGCLKACRCSIDYDKRTAKVAAGNCSRHQADTSVMHHDEGKVPA